MIMERLQHAQYDLEHWTANASALAGGDAITAKRSAQAPQMSALALASQKQAAELTEAAGSGMSLGQKLLANLRHHLGPTLADQLGGQDSPFQPPTLISSALDKTLRQHMAEVKRQVQGDGTGVDNSKLTHELGRALIELMREVSSSLARDIPRGGVERLHETVGPRQSWPAARLFSGTPHVWSLPPCVSGPAAFLSHLRACRHRSAFTRHGKRGRSSRKRCGRQPLRLAVESPFGSAQRAGRRSRCR